MLVSTMSIKLIYYNFVSVLLKVSLSLVPPRRSVINWCQKVSTRWEIGRWCWNICAIADLYNCCHARLHMIFEMAMEKPISWIGRSKSDSNKTGARHRNGIFDNRPMSSIGKSGSTSFVLDTRSHIDHLESVPM